MYLSQIFSKQVGDSEPVAASLPLATEVMSEVRFWTTHSEPADVEGGSITVHNRLDGVEEFILELEQIAQRDSAKILSVGFIRSETPNAADFEEVVPLHKVSVVSWQLAGRPFFNLRCELEDGRVYCFTPVFGSGSMSRSETLYERLRDSPC